MRKTTFNFIKGILREYTDLDKRIQEKEMELRYPHYEDDINRGIRGGSLNKDKFGSMMITIEQDKELMMLRRTKETIENLLEECDEDTRTIIMEVYIKKYPKHTVISLAEGNYLSCSKNTASKKRTKFFEYLASDLDIYR